MRNRVLCLAALLFAGCSGWSPENPCEDKPIDPDPIVARANREEATWAAKKPAAYSLLVDRGCFCDDEWWFSSVDGNESTAFVFTGERGGGWTTSVAPTQEYSTMESVFAQVRGMARAGSVSMSVSYDPALHHPTRFGGSFSKCASDSSVGYGVRIFNVEEETGIGNAFRCDAPGLTRMAGRWRLYGDAENPVTATVAAVSKELRVYSGAPTDATVLIYAITENPHGQACVVQLRQEEREREDAVYMLVAGPDRMVLWLPDDERGFARVYEH